MFQICQSFGYFEEIFDITNMSYFVNFIENQCNKVFFFFGMSTHDPIKTYPGNILGGSQGGYLKTDPYLEQISIIKNNNRSITLKMKLTIGMSQNIYIPCGVRNKIIKTLPYQV